jgi:hypothetical protein
VDAVAPTTAEVRMAAEMPAMMAATTEMCATMTTAVMTTAVATAMTATAMTAASMTATAAFGGGIPSGRQHGRENNDGNPDFRHGTLKPRFATNPRHVRTRLA